MNEQEIAQECVQEIDKTLGGRISHRQIQLIEIHVEIAILKAQRLEVVRQTGDVNRIISEITRPSCEVTE